MATESSFTCRCREPKKASRTHLPTEIIFEILLRLPVKSLLRFRCVSKSWRSLISQPKFAKTHVSLASVNTDYTHHRLILQGLWGDSDFKSCSLFSISNENSYVAVDIDCPLKEEGPYIPYMKEVMGSCDGLVCIKRGLEVFIWNPSTRKSKRLPELPYPGFIGYGFGYDESTDDYKVVGFCVHGVTGGYEVEMMVYTLRTDVWRRIGGFLHWLPSDGPGTYLNGALHWTSFMIDVTPSIVCLDLAKETHGEVLEPVYRDGPLYRRLLDVLNGCLCILCAHRDCADVWVMKEYGTRESWTKLVVIPKHQSGGPYSTIPLCILKNGELLLHNYRHLARYNPKDGTFICPTPTIRSCSMHSNVYPYVESLVSPDIDADRGVQWQHLY